jgi:hypothetical protein
MRVPVLFSGLLLASLCLSCKTPTNSWHAPPNPDTGSNISVGAICEFEGKLYFFVAPDEVLKSTPKWRPHSDFPPLPPRRAKAIAIGEAQRLRPDIPGWRLDNIELRQAYDDWWYYTVSLIRSDFIMGKPALMQVPVLMNGEAVHGTTEEPRSISHR